MLGVKSVPYNISLLDIDYVAVKVMSALFGDFVTDVGDFVVVSRRFDLFCVTAGDVLMLLQVVIFVGVAAVVVVLLL